MTERICSRGLGAAGATLLLIGLGCSAPRDDDANGVASHGGVTTGTTTGGATTQPSGGTGNAAAGRGAAAGSVSGGNASGGTASGGNSTGGGQSGSSGSAGAASVPPTNACDFPHDNIVEAATAADLARALASAKAGTMIRLADGQIHGTFKSSQSGAADRPIVLCGTRAAVLSGSDSSAVVTLEGDYWVLSGFSVTGGQKGVLLDGAQHNLLTGLSVHGIGNEGVHFRSASSDNVLEWSEVTDTGNAMPEYGEGVYIGTAYEQWEKITGSASTPDRSDRNVVRHNQLGPNVRAELIDVKEGTTGGVIQDNDFDGAGIAPGGFADSWVDVKGSRYSLTGNQGKNAANDGFQVHVATSGWGDDNVFRLNHATVDAKGYGFRISESASGTLVGCDNVVTGADAGLSNIGCKN